MSIKHIGIVGFGSIGKKHLRILKLIRPDIKVTLVRSGIGNNSGDSGLADSVVFSLEDAIANGIEAAIICSPAPFHVETAIMLIQFGIHLLIEKPLSNNLENLQQLVELANKKNTVVLIGYVLRYSSSARKFLSLIKNNSVGECLHARIVASSYLPDWRKNQNYKDSVSASSELGGGVLLELSHELDYIRWFFGEIKSIYANLHNSSHLGIDVEECADLILVNEQGMPISLHLDFHQKIPERTCIVAGSKGSIKWDAIANSVSWGETAAKIESITQESDNKDIFYSDQLEHFFECIEKHSKPIVSLHDGIKAIQLVEFARLSYNTGSRQAIQ